MLGALIWIAWTLAETYVSPALTRFWALSATALILIVAWASYNLGQLEAKGKLDGLDLGVERVTKAAATAIDLRAQAAREIRQPRAEPSVTLLPDPGPALTFRQQIVDGETVIDL